MNEPRELKLIQRWMQAVIMHPGGVIAGIDSTQAQSEIGVGSHEIERLVERSRKLSSIERLEVYGNAYHARLLECLRDEFPALVHAAGEEAFDALAFGYLQSYPSQSYTLANLGVRFPQYLRETRPEVAGTGDAPSWPDILIDLATLERTYSEVFDGPGVESKRLLSSDDLLAIPAERWPTTRLQTVDCLRLVRLQFPVHTYATAVKAGEHPEIPEPHPTCLAISRRDYVVRRWEISAAEHLLLESLQRGDTVGNAIQTVAESPEAADLSHDDLAARLREWFGNWTAWGFFQRVR